MLQRTGFALAGVVTAAALTFTDVPAARAQHEDTLSAKPFSAPSLLAEGYQVVAYEVVDDQESRLILKKRYKLALCVLEESMADDESIEIESTCYRLR